MIEEFKNLNQVSSSQEPGVSEFSNLSTMPHNTNLITEESIRALIQRPGLIDILLLSGLVETVTSIPTYTPTRFYNQFKIYVDSVTAPTVKTLYFYSNKTNTWIAVGGVAGNNTEVQFNNSGSLGASSSFTWDNGALILNIGGTVSGPGGSLYSYSLNLASTGQAQELTITAGDSNTTALKAGNLSIQSGSANVGDANGGDIFLNLGEGNGTGTYGRLNIANLPTSAAGLSTGDIWANSGVLTVV